MAEYIEREAMIEEMQRLIDNVSQNFPRASETELIILKGKYEAFMEYIKEQPEADVQPMKRGRWLEHRAVWIDQPRMEGWFVQAKCSECERLAPVLNRFTKSVVYEYCPHCGAIMDGADATKG